MSFPVEFHLLGRSIPAHAIFETLAYVVGLQTYLLLRYRQRERAVPVEQNLWLIVGCVLGALVGSKLLAWLESPVEYWSNRHNPAAWLGGKTIVGGLLGGWIGVEITKKVLGITQRTGDLFVLPLILGIAIGRIGCFLAGLPDHTHGVATSLPWGVDFGDGIRRHPTQIYEMIFLLGFGAILIGRTWRLPPGGLFRLFVVGYLTFRFLIEFIKPRYTGYLGLSAIQWVSLAGVTIAAISLARGSRTEPEWTSYVTSGR